MASPDVRRIEMVGCARQFQSMLPRRLRPVLRPLYYPLFRLQLRARCWLEDIGEANAASTHPIPPALLRFRVSEEISRRQFLLVGESCARIVQESAYSAGVPLSGSRRVLDFGCGCGRVLSWLIRECPDVEFHGADTDREAIAWCKSHMRPSFVANSPEPPLPFPEGHFDLVYSFSVFTHLNEDMQDLWLAELRRVLKSDGVCLLTVHGERAARALEPSDRARLHAHGFFFKTSRKLNGIMPDWYHTAWHSENYIVNRLSRWFTDVQYRRLPDATQDVVIARVPAA